MGRHYSGKGRGNSDKETELPHRFDPRFLEKADGRGRVVKALRERLGDIVSDRGGPDQLSHIQKAIIRRAVFVELQIEMIEQKVAEGVPVSYEEMGRWSNMVNALLGLYRSIGLKRIPKELVPDAMEWVQGEGEVKDGENG